MTNIGKIAEHCNIKSPTAAEIHQTFRSKGYRQKDYGKERHKIYTYQRYLDIIYKGIGAF